MIGGGGGSRIGSGPGPSLPDAIGEKTGPTKTGGSESASGPLAKVSDKFEKGGVRAQALDKGKAGSLGRDASGIGDLVKLSRENPTAAARICEGLASQAKHTLGEVERELAGARVVAEKLANERFTKEAREKSGRELRALREKITLLKRRYHATTRKLALLQQIAGQLGNPKIEEEVDRLLGNHGKLKTDWGRRYHMLSMCESLFSALDDAPEHLREVVQTEVKRASPEAAELLGDLSPQRIISELIARTLDGSTRDEPHSAPAAVRGDMGRAVQAYAMLAGALEKSLAKDPLHE